MFILKRILNAVFSLMVYSPLALVLMLKAVLFGLPGKYIARMRLPKAAEGLGLRRKPSNYIREFGELKGKVRGCVVTVSPEESMNPRISVTFSGGMKGLEVDISRPRMRAGDKTVDFAVADQRFNRIFRTRRVHRSSVDAVSGKSGFSEAALRFYGRWMFRIDSLRIDHDEVFCRLKYGFMLFPHIPARHLEALVTGMVDIAASLAGEGND